MMVDEIVLDKIKIAYTSDTGIAIDCDPCVKSLLDYGREKCVMLRVARECPPISFHSSIHLIDRDR